MVRNWDTIRAVLTKLEAAESTHATLSMVDVDGIAPQEVAYHMKLLEGAGFIKAKILKSSTGDGAIAAAFAQSLTWEGHDLLDTMRSKTVWEKIKAKAKEKGIELTFSAIKVMGVEVIKAMTAN